LELPSWSFVFFTTRRRPSSVHSYIGSQGSSQRIAAQPAHGIASPSPESWTCCDELSRPVSPPSFSLVTSSSLARICLMLRLVRVFRPGEQQSKQEPRRETREDGLMCCGRPEVEAQSKQRFAYPLALSWKGRHNCWTLPSMCNAAC
jgi:hypothetical protein